MNGRFVIASAVIELPARKMTSPPANGKRGGYTDLVDGNQLSRQCRKPEREKCDWEKHCDSTP